MFFVIIIYKYANCKENTLQVLSTKSFSTLLESWTETYNLNLLNGYLVPKESPYKIMNASQAFPYSSPEKKYTQALIPTQEDSQMVILISMVIEIHNDFMEWVSKKQK